MASFIATFSFPLTSAALVSAAILCFPGAASAQQKSARCAPALLQLLGKKLGLAHFSLPKEGSYPKRENGGLIVAAACKSMPDDPTKTIAAIVYDEEPDGDFGKQLFVVIVDIRKQTVVGTYTDALGVDATTAWHSESLTIDTGRYLLAPGTRAFGVRTNVFKDRCGYEGGFDGGLTLFVLERSSIRPIFSESMYNWIYGSADRCGGQDVPRIEANTSIAVARTSSKGYADLKLTATFSKNKKPISGLVKYNGAAYDLEPWRKVFETGWK